MLRMIKSELYKTRHRLYPYLLTGIVVALGLAAVILFAVANQGHPMEKRSGFDDVALMTVTMLPIGLYLCLPFVDMVFSEEYKYLTMKNTIAFGTPRASVYLGKLITQLLIAFASLFVILTVILGAGLVILGPVKEVPIGEYLRLVGERLLACLPLWIGGLCFGNMLAFHVKSSTMYALGYVGFFGLLPTIMQFAAHFEPAFNTVREWLISPLFDLIMQDELTQDTIFKCLIVGGAYAVGSTLIGIFFFRKKEIN